MAQEKNSLSAHAQKELIKDKDLRFNVRIRVYGESDNPTHSHGYLVDNLPTGVSPPIGTLNIDMRTYTLKQLRPMIEYNRHRHMNRRSLMFQGALFIFGRLPNIYGRPKEDLLKYSFGFIQKDGKEVKLIHPDREDEFISELMGAIDFFSHDLALIPWSQIPPTFQTERTAKKIDNDGDNGVDGNDEDCAAAVAQSAGSGEGAEVTAEATGRSESSNTGGEERSMERQSPAKRRGRQAEHR